MCEDQENTRARACPGYAPDQQLSSDLTDGQWQVIAPHLPADQPGRGPAAIWPLRVIVEAILYLDRTGALAVPAGQLPALADGIRVLRRLA